MTFYLFHRHRVCLVDHVDLICSLYSWWEGFGSSSLATLTWVSIMVLFPPLHVGRPHAEVVFSWGCPGGLGSAPVTARCGDGAATWITGALAAYTGELAARAAGNTVP